MALGFFQFYPASWLSDPDVRALTLEERGAYFDLLCRLWLAKGRSGRLPDDDRLLSDFLGVRIDVWRNRLKPRLKGSDTRQGVLRFEAGEVFNDRQQLALQGLRERLSEKVGHKSGKQPLNTAEKPDFFSTESNESAVVAAEEVRSKKLEDKTEDGDSRPKPAALAVSDGVFPELEWPERLSWLKAILDGNANVPPKMRVLNVWERTERLVESFGEPFSTRFADQLTVILAEFIDYQTALKVPKKRIDLAWLNNVKRWYDRELGRIRREAAWGKTKRA